MAQQGFLMRFDKSDLHQFTPEYISKLSGDRKDTLIEQLRADLIEAQDRIHQNSSNSSRPSSSDPPWQRNNTSSEKRGQEDAERSSEEQAPLVDQESDCDDDQTTTASDSASKPKRKPGKQKGAQGFGRIQKLAVTETVSHKPTCCAGCEKAFDDTSLFTPTGGHYTIDLVPPKPGEIGIKATNTKHIYGSVSCCCGFITTTRPNKLLPEEGWGVEISENRLIGPRLLSFIVYLKLRAHLTLDKTRHLLSLWLGIVLSDGCINTALREAGRSAAPLETEILEALRQADILYLDETSWKEHKVIRWLWTATSKDTAYYVIGPRSSEMANRILEGYQGWLMSDGYVAYRQFAKRIRCWPHLERKAEGLRTSWDKTAASFGSYAVEALKELRNNVYKMRELSEGEREPLYAASDELRLQFLYRCLQENESACEPVRKFCVEIVNDNEAIFRVLKMPEMPLSNNTAERSLRGCVILRNMCHGSKSEEGSKTVSILVSVIGTLQLRGFDPWGFLADLFAARRSGRSCPPCPAST